MEVLLALDQVELVRSQITFTTSQLDMARKTFAAGSGTRTDIDEAQSRLDMARAQELEALQQLDFTRRQLQVLISQPVGKLAPLDIKRMPLENPVPALLDDWTRLAEEKSPELQSLKARLEAARAEVSKAESGHYPTVDAVAQLINSNSENPNTPATGYTNKTIGLQILVPIYAGGYVNSTVRQALANEEQAKEELEAVRLDLGVRVH
jgi:outer membrane protein/protease secretion system outer membrane protein